MPSDLPAKPTIRATGAFSPSAETEQRTKFLMAFLPDENPPSGLRWDSSRQEQVIRSCGIFRATERKHQLKQLWRIASVLSTLFASTTPRVKSIRLIC